MMRFNWSQSRLQALRIELNSATCKRLNEYKMKSGTNMLTLHTAWSARAMPFK